MKAILTIISFALVSMLVPVFAYAQSQTDTSPTQTSQPQCLDFNQDKICEYVVLVNGTMVANPFEM